MTTTADVVEQARLHLQGSQRDARNKLDLAVDADDETVRVKYPLNKLASGSKLSVDLEDLYVWTTEEAARTAAVARGQFGTAAAAHALGAHVFVNPRWSAAEIVRAVNDELKDLSSPMSGLYAVRTLDFAFNPARYGYNLAAEDLLVVIDVRYQAPVGFDWPLVKGWRVDRDLDTAEFSSGAALFFTDDAPEPGRTVRVRYAAPFGPLAAIDDDVEEETGLLPEAHDILALGAALRLAASRPMKRTQIETQGDTRRPTEVSPGDTIVSTRLLAALHASRVQAEAARLSRRHPVVR